jgi:hypothetical protein
MKARRRANGGVMGGIKEKVESNPTVWLLGTLLTGFLSGIATYEAALRIMDLQTISRDRLKVLEQVPPPQGSASATTQQPLPSYLDKKEIDALFERVRLAFNERDTSKLFALLGPMARAQVTEEVAARTIAPTFDLLGKLESGFFVQSGFMGQQGLYKSFVLNYFGVYEKSKRGTVTIYVIDDGSSYQIWSMMFNPM